MRMILVIVGTLLVLAVLARPLFQASVEVNRQPEGPAFKGTSSRLWVHVRKDPARRRAQKDAIKPFNPSNPFVRK